MHTAELLSRDTQAQPEFRQKSSVSDERLPAAMRLFEYLRARHWRDNALVGPDPGVRLNYRIGRFIKSYLPVLPWRDQHCFMQAQGYWILANWRLFALNRCEVHHTIAVRCSEQVLARQRRDGAWEYPLGEWKGRIATAEGTWASIGLLETYRQTGTSAFLAGALRWHDFLRQEIGFLCDGEHLAVNYFASRKAGKVPNNSAFVLRFLAELSAATAEKACVKESSGLLGFLRSAQMPSGEFPYAIGDDVGRGRTHFQCYQYNAFACLDLLRYYELTGDPASLSLVRETLSFLRSGIGRDGHALYQCGNYHRAVFYHAAAMSAALASALDLRLGADEDLRHRTLSYVLSAQDRNGGFAHSRQEYGFLRDSRSYPRYQAMILYHLLH